MNPILQRQKEDLLQVYGADAEVTLLPSGAALVTLPHINLPAGWSKSQTSVRFLAPVGYPFAAPDCFWADKDLRLSNGAMPQAVNIQPIPDAGQDGLWFSWHVQGWNPNHNNLVTYSKVIQQRFANLR
jgi:hypothetical protein